MKNDGQCNARISNPGGYSTHRCSFKAKRDGWCGVHHPDAERARDEKKHAERVGRMEHDRARAHRRELNRELADAGQRVADLFETGELVIAPGAQAAATEALAKFLAAADRRRLLPS